MSGKRTAELMGNPSLLKRMDVLFEKATRQGPFSSSGALKGMLTRAWHACGEANIFFLGQALVLNQNDWGTIKYLGGATFEAIRHIIEAEGFHVGAAECKKESFKGFQYRDRMFRRAYRAEHSTLINKGKAAHFNISEAEAEATIKEVFQISDQGPVVLHSVPKLMTTDFAAAVAQRVVTNKGLSEEFINSAGEGILAAAIRVAIAVEMQERGLD